MMYNDHSQTENGTEKPPRRRFWQNLLINGSGDLKKLLSLSSLMMSFVILFVYIIVYLLLMPLLDRAIGRGPVFLVTLAEALIPAVIGTALIMLTWPLYRDKRVLPAAYVWLALIALAILAGVLFRLRDDPAARRTFLYIYLWDVVPPLIIGNIAAWKRYRDFLWK